MLHVIDPLTFVTGAIRLCAGALPLQLVLHPSALQHRLVPVDEAALPIRHSFRPLSKVVRLVWKDAKTLPVTLVVKPRPKIVSSVLQLRLRKNGFRLFNEFLD